MARITTTNGEDTSAHLTGLPLVLTMFALCAGIFCVALDITIISTAIPRITDEFHALQDIGWYGSAYLLTTCALQLPFGKIYGFFNPKWTFLASLFVFEVGSAVCGAAPSSAALIIGRAIQGIGGAGVPCGAMVIIAHITPMQKRALFQSFFGAMFGIASVVGPLLGGAFTDHVTWRWCFYINLPIGAITAVLVLFHLHLHVDRSSTQKRTTFESIRSLDPIGLLLFFPAVICILLALQWGGTKYPWSSGRIIALLVVFSITLIAFVIVQAYMGDDATVPPCVALQRTMYSVSIFAFFLFSGFYLLIYFLPIYFQAIHAQSPSRSGVSSIPLILSNVVAIMISGIIITKTGIYVPLLYICVVLVSIACALMTLLETDTGTAKWVGYQILHGFGAGCALQIPQIAAQNVNSLQDVPTAVAITMFAQNFGPTIMLSAGNNILNQKLLTYISDLKISEIDAAAVVEAGATGIRSVVPEQYLGLVLEAYNKALRQTFYVALAMSCATAIGALTVEWRRIRGFENEDKAAEKGAEDEKVQNTGS
ncbi:MFS general substrate transporter [Bimuria novae-zelandiae CBS 107.79]|uniref:MFS general substrate transporter n=1 Tax=Bimuria novae-zelandiae CBS 107.79 TaxID=1447943 RepID=A0A6A5VMG1_9PLEO|nr:MFS general substrate transporter [Bimuria novae-zelandiae CBS 107.79]